VIQPEASRPSETSSRQTRKRVKVIWKQSKEDEELHRCVRVQST
jgi:hypothetical protein